MFKDELLQDIKGLSGVPIFAAVALLALLLNQTVLFVQLAVGFVAIWVITIAIRALFFRKRPNPEKFTNIVQKIDASSFPSLHAGRAGVLAAILSIFFANPLITIFLSALAICVAVTRVAQKRHFVSDVIVGLVLGACIGIFVTKLI